MSRNDLRNDLIEKAKAHIERAASSATPSQAARIRSGGSDDERLSLLAQLVAVFEEHAEEIAPSPEHATKCPVSLHVPGGNAPDLPKSDIPDDERDVLDSFRGWTPLEVKNSPYQAARVISTLLDKLERRTVQGEACQHENCEIDGQGRSTRCADCGANLVQAEPSDARVLAALNAQWRTEREQSHFPVNPDAPDLSYFGVQATERMRAALRAAAETGGER